MGACYSMVSSNVESVGSWHDCSNPLNLPNHSYYFEVGTIFYPNLICPICWNKLLVLENYKAPVIAIQSRFGRSKNRHANKQQCGTDTL